MIFLNPLLGAAEGDGAGALSGKLSDVGVSDKFMKEEELRKVLEG